MSDMLSIGASSLRAYQAALTTTSENIASAGNAGYSRRTTLIREIVAPGDGTRATGQGLGVIAGGIARAADVYRTAEVRSAGADLARTQAGVTWLGRIEQALAGNKLGDRLTAFFTAATAVAADPGSLAPRAAMLEAAGSAADAFAATGAALENALADLDAGAGAATAELNGLAGALARVNAGLGRAREGTSGQAALLDERDRLLEAMSAIGDVAVSTDAAGRATVRLGGEAGPLLVQGEQAGAVSYARSAQGLVAYSVAFQGERSAAFPAGGALAGIGEAAAQLAETRDALAQLAGDFAEGVNAVQAAGEDLDGRPGAALFTVGDPGWRLALATDDPRAIAAALPGGGSRDNGNLAALAALRGSGGFEDRLASLTARNAAALSARRTVAEAQGAIRDSAAAERDAALGVNLDEEAVDLIRFQQAYQASSRVIQVARDTLQSILDIR